MQPWNCSLDNAAYSDALFFKYLFKSSLILLDFLSIHRYTFTCKRQTRQDPNRELLYFNVVTLHIATPVFSLQL